MNNIYISLFHGRDTAEEDLEDWGYPGPVIGPFDMSWTYGNIKLHERFGNGFEYLPVTSDDLVLYDGKFYGDFDVITKTEMLAHLREAGREFHDWQTLVTKIKRRTEVLPPEGELPAAPGYQVGQRTGELIAIDPRGKEYGSHVAQLLPDGRVRVAHTIDGYEMTFANAEKFVAWARRAL